MLAVGVDAKCLRFGAPQEVLVGFRELSAVCPPHDLMFPNYLANEVAAAKDFLKKSAKQVAHPPINVDEDGAGFAE
jgi:hypothetical protein